MSHRDVILGRIRGALGDVGDDEPAAWERSSAPDSAAYTVDRGIPRAGLAELFAERCSEYRANVAHCREDPDSIAAAIAEACRRHDVRTLAVPADLDERWGPAGPELRPDEPPLTVDALDSCDGLITACSLAIALTGTIALDGGEGQGRRALSLVPDLHICVVRASQIVAGVPEAIERLAPAIRDGRPVTLISGPSATSDIELRRVEGVHGPRRLEVIVAAKSSDAP